MSLAGISLRTMPACWPSAKSFPKKRSINSARRRSTILNSSGVLCCMSRTNGGLISSSSRCVLASNSCSAAEKSGGCSRVIRLQIRPEGPAEGLPHDSAAPTGLNREQTLSQGKPWALFSWPVGPEDRPRPPWCCERADPSLSLPGKFRVGEGGGQAYVRARANPWRRLRT